MNGRKQKRRKDFLILSFGVAASLLRRIDEAVAEHRKNSRGAAMNRSEWIRRAIERDLAHRDRSRGRKGRLVVVPTPTPTVERSTAAYEGLPNIVIEGIEYSDYEPAF